MRGGRSAGEIESLTSTLDEKYGEDGSGIPVELMLALESTAEWDDETTADLLHAIRDRLQSRALDPDDLARWLKAHGEEPKERERVNLCLAVNPPSQVSVQKVLSLAGAQKIVFLCHWSVTEREIVLKQFVDPEVAEGVFSRELRLHPFSMEHPNIIDTHYFTNDAGDEFLAERFIETQDEDWRSEGAFEATNLLHDLAAALQFIHHRGLIHGDVKPDNTGYDQGKYLLLDFGVCREIETFAEGYGPTGTLRTRAPELIKGETPHTTATDVWALGATVFHTLFGHYPLFDPDQGPPGLSEPEQRSEFEGELAGRIDDEFPKRVLEPLEELSYRRLAEVLGKVLARDPDERFSAEEVAAECRTQIAAQTRAFGKTTSLSSKERLRQLAAYLPASAQLSYLPVRKRKDLRAELRYLRVDPGLTEEEVTQVEVLEEHLGEA